MNALDLSPAEAWDAAEEQIDLWQEGKEQRRRAEWKALHG